MSSKSTKTLKLCSNSILFPPNGEDSIMYEMYNIQMSTFWFPNEVDLSKERNQYLKLSPQMQKILRYVVGFLSTIDSEVIDSDWQKIIGLIPKEHKYTKIFYTGKLAIEVIHLISYQLLTQSLFPEDIKEVMSMGFEIQETINMNQWIEDICDSSDNLGYIMLAVACVEGIFLMCPFFFIFFLRKEGLMEGTVHLNELISKDEAIHREAALIYCSKVLKINSKDSKYYVSKEDAVKLISDAVDLQLKFIDLILKEHVEGLSVSGIKTLVKDLGNYICRTVGYSNIWTINKDLIESWMFSISTEQKNNFYERGSANYTQNVSNVIPKNDIYDDPFSIVF